MYRMAMERSCSLNTIRSDVYILEYGTELGYRIEHGGFGKLNAQDLAQMGSGI
jgi:hypothetical protein